ncbi:MAG: choice-of-anchor D domain-containing protein, partial [Nitrospirae bacterium]|nr:choice-of-anchor D domain-containing protein [Candidatus Manganitrophaceae bacterium]
EGIQGLKVNANGELEVLLGNGKLIQRSPYIYQEINGQRVEIEGAFELIDKIDPAKSAYGYRFELAAYDKSRPLVIDPILDYSTFLGGSDNSEAGIDIAVDSAGNAYVTGTTLSADFLSTSLWPAAPSPTTLQSELAGGIDIFVTKFNATGTAILYSTFLGGSGDDEVKGIALDTSGNVYITGKTLSSDFPLQAAIQTTRGGGTDAFVAKIDVSGSNLIYSTYLGGGASDISHGIAVDSSGFAYLTGETSSNDFPTNSPNNAPFQPNLAGASSGIDAFISKIDPAGTALVYSTYLGGSIQDYAYAIAVDAQGNAYVTGTTASLNFPTSSNPAPYQGSKAGLEEAFVVKMNPEGETLVYGSYLGGSGNDEAKAIAVDGAGFAYVAGRTSSFNFPLVSAFQTTKRGIWDAFFTKINPTGTAIVYSSLFGGNGKELIHDIAVNASGSLFLVGETDSAVNFPIFAPASSSQIQENHGGGNDAFISRVNAGGSTLIYSTYLGGSLNDESYGIAIDSVGNVYTTGETGSANFPTQSATQAIRPGGGDGDAFVSKISHLVLGPEIQVTDSVLPGDDLEVVFGDHTIGTTQVESLTITNGGDTALSIGTIATTNLLAAPFSIENDLCSDKVLISSQSCVLEVHFSPTAEVFSEDDFDIPSNDTDEDPLTIRLSGEGVPVVVPSPEINLSRMTVPFGDVSTDTTRDETLTITNKGDAVLILGQIASINPLNSPFSILSNFCSGQRLSTDATCVIEIRFAPTLEIVSNDDFDIPSNDPDEDPVTIAVTGTGTISTVAKIDVRDSAAPNNDLKIPFGSVSTGENSGHRVTIENLGNEALIIGAIAENNALAAPYMLQDNQCSGMTLPTNSTCTFNILFSPSSVVKPLDSFDIPSSDPNRSVVTLSVSGNGVSGPAPDMRILQGDPLSASQNITFPEIAIGQTLEKIVTLKSIGSAVLEIGTIPTGNLIEVPFSLVDDQCTGKSLLFFESCTFKVRFAPISEGLFSDAFDIPSNDPDGVQVFSLNGSGVQNAINNSPSKPVLRFPANGQQGLGTDLRFEWERSTDSDRDPISYTLLVCDDPDPTVCNAALDVSQ